ncbi:MAG: hypothetical protein UX89_C0003G0013 [Parcubacteria group bacterium GW2011_GWA2_47_16]|nr:MAG: hypothetical protein UX89_C0003G0013 [Parcubacteria group bacterium GW2011_GWA2_47_16]
MKLNIKELLDFFDDKKDSQKGDANALMSILGEDLNASVYRHFRGNGVEILNDSVTLDIKKGDGTRGKELDRWIVDRGNRKLYQCEIKNSAATAIGGKQLESDANNKKIREVVTYHWNRELKKNFSRNHGHPNYVTKVLLTMRKPKKFKNLKVEPLLVYWMPITSSKNDLKPLSVLHTSPLHLGMEIKFSKLYIFSVSLYLRSLLGKGKGVIVLEMPHFEHRLKILAKLRNK